MLPHISDLLTKNCHIYLQHIRIHFDLPELRSSSVALWLRETSLVALIGQPSISRFQSCCHFLSKPSTQCLSTLMLYLSACCPSGGAPAQAARVRLAQT